MMDTRISQRPLLAHCLVSLLLIMAVVLPAALKLPAAQASAPSAAGAPVSRGQLREHLNADGSLHAAGLAGNLEAAGFQLSLGPGGAPRFLAAPSLEQSAPAEGWDDRFGAPGLNGQIPTALALAESGDLYVGGRFTELPGLSGASGIARWDGRRWHGLSTGLAGNGLVVNAIAPAGNAVYVVGDFELAGDTVVGGIALWDGQSWSRLGSGAGAKQRNDSFADDGYLYAAAVGPDGQLYVGGHFNEIDGVPAEGVARWDGQGWHALGAGLGERAPWEGAARGLGKVYALALGPDGSLYAGGEFNEAGTVAASGVARWDGQIWHALGAGLTNDADGAAQLASVRALAVSDTTLYAAGSLSTAGGAPARNVARWDGQGWHPLGAGLAGKGLGEPEVLSLLLDDGALVAGGRFTSAGGKAAGGLARWDGDQWSALAQPLQDDTDSLRVDALAPASGGGFFAIGKFDRAAGRNVFNIARWTGQEWASLGQGVSGLINLPEELLAVTVDSLGRIYVGGRIRYVGGLPVNNIAMWDGARWHSLGDGVQGGDGPIVYALIADGEDIYVGGSFTQAGDVAASNIARWDGATGRWSALGAGISGTGGTVRALAIGDGRLFAGGAFEQAGGAAANDVASWDGASWSSLGGDYEIYEIFRDSGQEAGTYVNALAFHNGELFIGGRFHTIHERASSTQDWGSYLVANNVVSYVLASEEWLLAGDPAQPGVTFLGSSGMLTRVYALAVADNALYVGGNFREAGGLLAQGLARYDLVDGSWSAPGDMVGGDSDELAAYSLGVSGSYLYVGGSFTSIGGLQASRVARYAVAGGQWEPLGDGVRWQLRGALVRALVATPSGVYLGGQFDAAGPHPAVGVARWSGPQGAPIDAAHRLHLPLLHR
jgi:hypothetical protein